MATKAPATTARAGIGDFKGIAHSALAAEVDALRAQVPELEQSAADNARAKKYQEALYRIADVTWSARNIPALYDALHEIISQLMPARNFLIAVHDEDGGTISIPYHEDEEDYDPDVHVPVSIDEFLQTLTGYVFRTGEPLLADRQRLLELHNSGQAICRGPMSESWLGVPFHENGEVFGAVVVQSYSKDYVYGREEQELLVFVSQQIATAISRKRSEEALKNAYESLEETVRFRTAEISKANSVLEQEIAIRKRSEDLQAVLYRIAHLTNSNIELDDFFPAIHRYIGGLLFAENCYIALLNEQTQFVHFHYYVDHFDPNYHPRDFSLQQDKGVGGLTERVLRSGEAILVNEGTPEYETARSITNGNPSISWLGIPLRREGNPVGVLVVQSYSSEVVFTEQDKALLTFVGEHISTALQRKQDGDLLKIAHAEVTSVNNELEQRIDERTQELIRTNEKLRISLEQRKSIQEELAHAACHDALTGLPNRTLLLDRMENAIHRNVRSKSLEYALLFLDLDRFKVVNDSLGHHVGDSMLIEVGKRLVECVRPGDTVARLGGDEFCILLESIKTERQVIATAKRILKVLESPVRVGERTMYISTSIGITLGSPEYYEANTILRDADTAMYQAKSHGKSQYAIFNRQMYRRVVSRLQHESELRRALQEHQIDVAFQPIVDLYTNRVVSFEVLARWRHPELGEVSPTEFIRIAEETGIIGELGMQILDKAMQRISAWQEKFDLGDDLYFCVNLSAAQFTQRGLLEMIKKKLKSYQIPACRLRMEITESMFLDNLRASRQLLNRFHQASICVVLDDFGTGYSSLSYLHKLPFSSLKIDRSFIRNLEKDVDSETIVRTINSLAETLGVSVVAEGIENEAQLEIVRRLGVCYGQGYLFARPLKTKAAERYMQKMFGPKRVEQDKVS